MQDILASMSEWMEAFLFHASGVIGDVQSMPVSLRVLVGGLAALLEMNVVTGLIVPGDTVILVLASAVSTPGQGLALGIAIMLGSVMGQSIGYGLGRLLVRNSGNSGRFRLRGRKSADRLEAARNAITRNGGPVVLASRFLPVFRTVIPFAVGMSDFSFRRFLAWTVPASALWSALFITVYSLAATSLRDGSGSGTISVLFGALGVALYFFAFLAQRLIIRTHRRRADPKEA